MNDRLELGLPLALDWMSQLSKGLVLVLGGPASGKTTALDYLATRAAAAEQAHLQRPNLKSPVELLETLAPAARTVVYADYETEQGLDLYDALWSLGDDIRENIAEVIDSAFALTLVPTRNGPVLASEVFLCRPDLRGSLAQSHSSYQLRARVEKCEEVGMQTWMQCLLALRREGKLTAEEAVEADPYGDAKRAMDRVEQFGWPRLNPTDRGRTQFQHALTTFRQGEIEKAVQEFQRAIELIDPPGRPHFLLRAALCLWRPRPDKARELAQRAIDTGGCDSSMVEKCRWMLNSTST